MKETHIYIHTWKINNWKEIQEEQLRYIDESGLGDESSIHICSYDSELKTQLEMWEHAKNYDCNYLYLHNLGTTWYGTEYEELTSNWRRWIMDNVVNKYQEYRGYLKDHDVVADNWKDDSYFKDWHPDPMYKDSDLYYPRNFCTNMWWTKSEYLRTLPHPIVYESQPTDLPTRRAFAETWIVSNDGDFKEVVSDFSKEPIEAYKNRKKKNPLFNKTDGGVFKNKDSRYL